MRYLRRAGLAGALAVALAVTGASAASAAPTVTDLRVDSRADQPLGMDDTTPDFSWQVAGAAAQSAYEIRVAGAAAELASGPYLWQTGKVSSSAQSDVVYAGAPLTSRRQVAWQVRAWDSNGDVSPWSAPSTFEMGLLAKSDWGAAKWIEYAGRTNTQPQPMFARAFTPDAAKTVRKARLYITGLGVFDAHLNGQPVSSEVLAPGYTNFQLSTEYRTYDVTGMLAPGSNTLAVELGNGVAYNTRAALNAAAGRTAPFAWWISTAVGAGTLTAPAAAGDTRVNVSSVANYYLGGAINVDTGDGGDRLESRTITAIGTTAAATTLGFPAAPGDTNVKLFSVAGMGVGGNLLVDTGAAQETVTITAVGTARTATTLFSAAAAGDTNVKVTSVTGFAPGNLIAVDTGAGLETRTVTAAGTQGRATTLSAASVVGATNIRVASVTGLVAGGEITVGTGTNLETATILTVGTQGANGTGLTLTAPLTLPHANGNAVRYGGTGITFTPALGAAHASGAAAVSSGSGVDFTPALAAAHASGVAATTPGTGISFTPALDAAHASAAAVTGSGNPLAVLDPSAAAMVTPRLISRLEITYTDGSTDAVVSDRNWRTALGATVTDQWYAGSDYDARREQAGWTLPGADLSSTATRRDGSLVGWTSAGIAPAPNLTTELSWRSAEPVEVEETLVPVTVTNPVAGTWVFDLGQGIAGWPELHLDGSVPAGTIVRLQPAESLNANGTVNSNSMIGGGASRGTQVFATYTSRGNPAGETWHPTFGYFAMQYVQVTGLPAGYTPTAATIRGLRLQGQTEQIGDVETSNARVNRIHLMSEYSIMSNTFSTFTDCPGREKLAYGADYVQPMGSLAANFDYSAYLRNMERQLVEGQSKGGADAGNVALKTPVYDWGYSDNFGDEINWGSSIVQVPWLLYSLYGNTQTMRDYYPQMKTYMDFLARRKAGTGADAYIVVGLLGDWVSAESTSTSITGTWGYYLSAKYMAQMAALTGHAADAADYTALANNIKAAFNSHFFNTTLHRYTAAGNGGTTGATQTAQALALDAGLVPDGERQNVLDAMVANIYAYHPFGGGPHFSAGHIGLGPVVRSLADGGRADVLWDVMQENTRPGYGFFMAPSTAHPTGLTTIPEQWDLGNSQNHMILLQIEEWFHTGLAGIKQAPGSAGYQQLIIKPTVIGDLTHVAGHYETPRGMARSEWTRGAYGITRFDVTVPSGAPAKVYVPATSASQTFVATGGQAVYAGYEPGYQVYDVAPGDVTFVQGVSTPGGIGGSVPATLSLTLGPPAAFGAFTPGLAKDYAASTTANVVSTAGDAALSVADPSSVATGHLVNGAFSLPSVLQARASSAAGVGGAFANVGGSASPTTLLSYSAPTSNDAVTVAFQQHIGATDALRTGAYSKTLTFTLSTTTP